MGNRTSCCGCDNRDLAGISDKLILKEMFSEDTVTKDLEARMSRVNWANEPIVSPRQGIQKSRRSGISSKKIEENSEK